jgi:uncharacterized RDD family membrane protein YckC
MDVGTDLRSESRRSGAGRDVAELDELSIDTPELVSIDLPLAGIGSRFIALLVDYLIWGAGLLLLFGAALLVLPAMHAFNVKSAQWAEALVIFLTFLFNWGYFTLFEAFWHGQTPGKRVARIRVIQRSGRSIGLLESMARNLVRYVDQIPFFYAVGTITMFVNRQHQRLGDMAAGTLVVRDREPEAMLLGGSGTRTITAKVFSDFASPEQHEGVMLQGAGLHRLSITDLEVLESFLARRLDMDLVTREALAKRIGAAIQSKAQLDLPAGLSIETFLEAVARQLRDQVRMH